MSVLNPLQLMMLLKSGNPQAVAEQIIQNNFPNNPLFANLLQMGRNNDINGIRQFGQQYLGQFGKDLNTELNNLLSMVQQS